MKSGTNDEALAMDGRRTEAAVLNVERINVLPAPCLGSGADKKPKE